jgi:hypothetical protein
MLAVSIAHNDGHFTYALDDAYIHMAMAKNLANHGVFGVSRTGFASASSSPLWVLLIACGYRLLGVGELLPLALDLACALALVLVADAVLRRRGVEAGVRAVALLALVVLVPIVPLAFSGLEHLLHVTVSLLFAATIAEAIASDAPDAPSPRKGALVLLAALVAAVRYEGLFLVGAASLLLVARRRIGLAALVGVSGLIAPVTCGLYAVHHGWRFLPTSILLKGRIPDAGWHGVLEAAGGSLLLSLYDNLYLLPLLVAGGGALTLARRRGGLLHAPWSVLILLATITTAFHLQLARAGIFYRYEAYLIGLWVIALTTAWPHLRDDLRALVGAGRRQARLAGVVAALAALPLVLRGVTAHPDFVAATGEIHAQQYQMGRFVRRYYDGHRVAANDIGAISFLADVDLFDLFGLATKDVIDARLSSTYGSARIEALTRARRVEIGIAYEDWFRTIGGLPPSWRRIGTWTIPTQVVVGARTVTFYAVDPDAAADLARHLRDYSAELPSSVVESGAYKDPAAELVDPG